MEGKNDDQVGKAGDVLQPGGAGRVDLELAADVGETVRPEVPARVDVLADVERRVNDSNGAESDQSLMKVSHFS
jgi:hypothetical protein